VPFHGNFALCPTRPQEAQFKNEYLGRKNYFKFFCQCGCHLGRRGKSLKSRSRVRLAVQLRFSAPTNGGGGGASHPFFAFYLRAVEINHHQSIIRLYARKTNCQIHSFNATAFIKVKWPRDEKSPPLSFLVGRWKT
jgi:hypothetical protein